MNSEKIKHHLPLVLSAVGGVGVFVTAIFAVKATPLAYKKLQEEAGEGEVKDIPVKEKIRLCWKDYLPTAISAGVTVGCIFGAHGINSNNQAALLGASALVAKNFEKYKDSAKELFGDTANSDILAHQVQKQAETSDDLVMIYNSEWVAEGDERLFYESISKRYFTASLASVLAAEYLMNRTLRYERFITLNQFYTLLGLEPIEGHDHLGWDTAILSESEPWWIDFDNGEVILEDGLSCNVISTWWEPAVLEPWT